MKSSDVDKKKKRQSNKLEKARRQRDHWKEKYENLAKILEDFPRIEREVKSYREVVQDRNELNFYRNSIPDFNKKLDVLREDREKLIKLKSAITGVLDCDINTLFEYCAKESGLLELSFSRDKKGRYESEQTLIAFFSFLSYNLYLYKSTEEVLNECKWLR